MPAASGASGDKVEAWLKKSPSADVESPVAKAIGADDTGMAATRNEQAEATTAGRRVHAAG
jgi:hypothetical protein